MLGRVAGLRERSRDLLLQLCPILQQDAALLLEGHQAVSVLLGCRLQRLLSLLELGLQHPGGLLQGQKRAGREESFLGHEICVAETVLYKYWFLGWVGKSRGGAQLSRAASMTPCHLKSSPPSPAPPSPSALLAQAFSARAPHSDHCSSSCRVAQLLLRAATPTRTRVHTHTNTHTVLPSAAKYLKNMYSKSCPTLLFRYHPTRSHCPWNKIQPPSMADKGLLPPGLSRDLSWVLSACPRSLRQLFLLPELFFKWLASFLFNGFIETEFIYLATDPFKADNSVVVSIFTGLCQGYCDNFSPFLSATETNCIPSPSPIPTSKHSSTLCLYRFACLGYCLQVE